MNHEPMFVGALHPRPKPEIDEPSKIMDRIHICNVLQASEQLISALQRFVEYFKQSEIPTDPVEVEITLRQPDRTIPWGYDNQVIRGFGSKTPSGWLVQTALGERLLLDSEITFVKRIGNMGDMARELLAATKWEAENDSD